MKYTGAVITDLHRQIPKLHATLIDSLGGYGESALSGVSSRGGDVARPVERLAGQLDPAARDLDALYVAVDALQRWAAEVDAIQRRWSNVKTAGRSCANELGCPSGRQAAPGRKRCEACRRYLERHGAERTAERRVA